MKYIASITMLMLVGGYLVEGHYCWLTETRGESTLASRISPPPGYQRVAYPAASFADWLRHLPLKPEGSAVYLFNGKLKNRQDVHHAVIDIDVGSRDLQQCADAVIRLRAEYLFSRKRYNEIWFSFTSGHRIEFKRWRAGERPLVSAHNRVIWKQSEREDDSYASFRRYLDTIFMYAGSMSLSKDLHPVTDDMVLEAGDVLIQGGFPGHAVIIIDKIQYHEGKRFLFLLAQSYMPAQNIHILVNPLNNQISPWYDLSGKTEIETPEWTFTKGDIKRFSEESAR